MNRRLRKEQARRNHANSTHALAASAPLVDTQTDNKFAVVLCVLLAVVIWGIFGQTLQHEFVDYDDDVYVYENRPVSDGLSLQGISWAFTQFHGSNWHPLTWLSHMLDCQLYGLDPGGHHLTNVLLHATVAILLFLVLRGMTGALGRSAMVAAVFAIHPLRVESVAWVAERKDLLSGLFFMLTLWMYTQYLARPSSRTRYLSMLLLFALGLMSKPMLVTLPWVLLLLDYWPLNRFPVSGVHGPDGSGKRQALSRSSTLDSPMSMQPVWWLIVEKIPLFALSIASCAITVLAETTSMMSIEKLSFPARIGNAMVSYTAYLGQMVYPVGLAVLYPLVKTGIPLVIFSMVLLVAISVVVFVWRREFPYLLTGWFWYLGMMVPVIGVVQVGLQARADRYTYLPQIGLILLLTWAFVDMSARWRHGRLLCGAAATAIMAILIVCAWIQTSYWQNSQLLWTHALACTSQNSIAHNNLGNTFQGQGKIVEAIEQYHQVLRIKPDDAQAHYNLGTALKEQGKVAEAIEQYNQTLRIKPGYADAHYNLGLALLQQGKTVEAIEHYHHALQIKPDYAEALSNLGAVLQGQGEMEVAIKHYQHALRVKPDYAEAHFNLGVALHLQGKLGEAIEHYRQALRIKPNYKKARHNLGVALQKQRESE